MVVELELEKKKKCWKFVLKPSKQGGEHVRTEPRQDGLGREGGLALQQAEESDQRREFRDSTPV